MRVKRCERDVVVLLPTTKEGKKKKTSRAVHLHSSIPQTCRMALIKGDGRRKHWQSESLIDRLLSSQQIVQSAHLCTVQKWIDSNPQKKKKGLGT